MITPGLRSSVVHFKVDKRRQWSLHRTVKKKTIGRISISKWSDHKGFKYKLSVPGLASKTSVNIPVINYSAQGGWDKHIDISKKGHLM